MQKQMAVDVLQGQSLLFDDLAVEIEDEYNPMLPNNYEKVIRERREEHDRIREEEVGDRYTVHPQTSIAPFSTIGVH